MGCFSNFFLFALNFIVFGVGVVVIALASLILANSNEFQALLSEGTFTVPVILLILGIVVMLIGFFGCFGALRQSPCLLYTYAAIVLVLLIGQVAVAVYGFLKQDDLKTFISNNMILVFNGYGRDDEELTKSLDATQHKLKCCGVFNYTDWTNGVIESGFNNPGYVPESCCKFNTTNCNKVINLKPDENEVSIYTIGCYTLLIDTIEEQALWLGIGAIVLAIVQLACVLIACGIGKKASQSSIY